MLVSGSEMVVRELVAFMEVASRSRTIAAHLFVRGTVSAGLAVGIAYGVLHGGKSGFDSEVVGYRGCPI